MYISWRYHLFLSCPVLGGENVSNDPHITDNSKSHRYWRNKFISCWYFCILFIPECVESLNIAVFLCVRDWQVLLDNSLDKTNGFCVWKYVPFITYNGPFNGQFS